MELIFTGRPKKGQEDGRIGSGDRRVGERRTYAQTEDRRRTAAQIKVRRMTAAQIEEEEDKCSAARTNDRRRAAA